MRFACMDATSREGISVPSVAKMNFLLRFIRRIENTGFDDEVELSAPLLSRFQGHAADDHGCAFGQADGGAKGLL